MAETTVHPDLAKIAESLTGGDIEHYAAQAALDALSENWTNAIDETPDGREGLKDNLLDQYDRLIGVLKALRPQVSAALEAAVDATEDAPSP